MLMICSWHLLPLKPVKTKKAAHLSPWILQLDFIQMQKCCSYEYVLVIEIMFSGWVEAYPCAKADTHNCKQKVAQRLYSKVWYSFIPKL